MTKVTVLMPTYNVAPYVKEAVESVLRQSYSDFELLVIDDCSTDGTLDVVRGISDSRIHIVQNERNLGLADNLNRGLSLIKTELVSRMDGDDIAEPHWLQSEVAVLESHPEIGICGGGFERFGAVSTVVRLPEHPQEILANMLFECSIIVPTFRMSLYRDKGLRYRSDAFPAEDYRFWADCLRVTKAYNVQDTLFHYRMHPKQICTSLSEKQKGKVEEVRRYMLELLGSNMTENEKDYFLKTFVDGKIADKQEWKQKESFARKLVALNRDESHFEERALKNCIQRHLQIQLYNTVLDCFFNDGYKPSAYFRYLSSGLALKTLPRLEMKLLAKSMLHRS